MTTTLSEEKCNTGTPGDCHQTLYWCSKCESVLCENCWGLQPVHKSGTGSRTRVKRKEHEKTELAVADYVLSVLEPNSTEETLAESHVTNVQTRWFGVEINENSLGQASLRNKPFLELASGSGKNPSLQYPCLVSFIGETGAGKSTLINAMMKSVGAAHIPEITPVIGTRIHIPTSHDVHLFPDPKTLTTTRPLFFADCEGFGGGDGAPLGARAVGSNRKFKLCYNPYRTNTHKREISTSEKYTRRWAVEELYPRILFTFSDVVCLVSRNFRKIENHIIDLLTWADRVFEKSVNQPILPVAIIVINGVDDKGDANDNWWDVDNVTKEVLENHRDRINLYCEPSRPHSGLHMAERMASHPTVFPDSIARLVDRWRTQCGRTINSLEDLILCYYSDFKVICIPSAHALPNTINKQYAELGKLITVAAQDSEKARKKAMLLMTSEDLEYYLERGFNHFSQSTEPFDFVRAAVKRKSISMGFSDHLLSTARTLLRQQPNDSTSKLLQNVAQVAASSIFLDAIRKGIRCNENSTLIFEIYRQQCETMQGLLYEYHWYCEEKDKYGNRCVNKKNGHTKGHQDSWGKVFGGGEFRARDKLDSKDQIKSQNQRTMDYLQRIFSDWEEKLAGIVGFEEQKRAAIKLHLTWISVLHNSSRTDISPELPSHTTCSCCVISIPLYPLFCGHVICQECLECFAEKNRDYFQLSRCPLHNNHEWVPPWTTKFSPPTAGLRILSLDGGGVRSIVQLTILEELERLIDLDVNIVDFFDLVIGTSGGGIVAAGLGIKKFTTQECIENFQHFSKRAFIKQTTIGSIIGLLIEAQHQGKYKTRYLEEGLRGVFGEKAILFGGRRDPAVESSVRVGVSTTTSRKSAFLLANYQRPQLPDSEVARPAYNFFRGETAEQELKVWEAIRATSAAPRYFKSFYHQASGYTFDDGGIMYNNPVVLANTERKMIWPEQKDKDPDILLSIGNLSINNSQPDERPVAGAHPKPILGRPHWKYSKKVFNIAKNTVESDLDCESAWSNFYDSLNIAEEDKDRKNKYPRINPKISNEPPALDSASSMDELQAITRNYCSISLDIKNVASTLIASLFYFELRSAKECPQVGLWECEGEILCRLPAGSNSLKTLCNRLRQEHQIGGNHQAWFHITRVHLEHQELCDAAKSAQEAVDGGNFRLSVTFEQQQWDTSCRIYVSLDGPNSEGFLISGFPRDPLQDKTWPLYRNFLPSRRDDKVADSGGNTGLSYPNMHKVDDSNHGALVRPG